MSLSDLLRRNGIAAEVHREEWVLPYEHVFRTGIFEVADLDGRIVAHAAAIVREGLWFLSAFWALPTATALDRAVVSAGRGVDHAFWLAEPGREGRAVLRDGRVAGYYYVQGGTVGPAAWLDPADAEAVLRFALADADARADEVRIAALGANHSAVRIALDAGLRLAGYSHFLTSAPFGALERYVPSGPALF